MIRVIALILCTGCLWYSSAFAQDQRSVDSLYKVLEHRVGVCEQFEIFYDLCFEFIKRDNMKALGFILKAEVAAASSGDSLSIVKSMRVKGIVLYYLERNVEALEIFEKVLPIAERNGYERERVFVHQFVGRIYLYEGQYDKALFVFLEGLQLALHLNEQAEIGTAWHDVAVCYYKLRDYNQALQYYSKALESYKSLSMHHALVVTNIALCYAHLGELKKAKEANEMVVRMSEEECSSGCQMNLKYSMGLVAMLGHNYSQAERYLRESYVMAQRLRDTRFQLDNIYLLTEIYVKQNRFKKAQRYLDIAEGLMQKNPSYNLEMIKIYSRCSEVYNELQDFKKASFYQARYIALRDSIYREELTNNLMKVQAEYLERENQSKIAAQAEIISLTTRVADEQRKLTTAVGVLAGLVAVILIFVFLEYKRKKRMSILLDKRVCERTTALEFSRTELMSIVKEQELILEHISRAIRQKLKTIEGLCKTAKEDLSDPKVGFYAGKIQTTLKEMEEGIESMKTHVDNQ